jgi:Histidine phosphatase superfamily (branch 1)
MNSRKSEELDVIYMVRHGETAWSRTGQLTGLTDLPLTELVAPFFLIAIAVFMRMNSHREHRVHRVHNDTSVFSVFSVASCIHTFENWRIVSDGSTHSKVAARIPNHFLRIHDPIELLRADEASVHRGVAQCRILF